MSDDDSRFEKMRLEVLREVDSIRNNMQQDVSDVRTEVSTDVAEIKNDIKNLRWFIGIAFSVLLTIFSLILAIMAYLANII